MKAWTLNNTCNLKEETAPLNLALVDLPKPGASEVSIKISCCGVCHTELDEIEGRTPPPHFPIIPGHQVIGTVADTGENANKYKLGDRVGVAWIYASCGKCEFCLNDQENLCRAMVQFKLLHSIEMQRSEIETISRRLQQ